MSEAPDRVFTPSPTMAAFMKSTASRRLLAGPIGGGKSVCCVHTLMEAMTIQEPNARGERRTKMLIVRNTKDQLMSTTWKTVTEWIEIGEYAVWKATEKTLYIEFPHGDTTVKSEWVFVALDDPDDVRKALSLEATWVWCNEWREIHPDVAMVLPTRTGRYPPPKDGVRITRSGAIFDTNMPMEDSWHWQQCETPPANWSIHVQPPAILNREEYLLQEHEDPIEADAIKDIEGTEWWPNPHADNKENLDKASPTYYQDAIPGMKMDFIRSFLRSQYARSLSGLPVYEKTFRFDFHVAKEPFKPIASDMYPVTVGVDFGRTPAAVFKQKDPRGRIITLSELNSENMGLETFITTKLKPHIYEKYQRCAIVLAPDPAGDMKQQMGEITLHDILRREGFKVVKPASNDPEKRIACVERQLSLQIDSQAMYQINPECVTLIKGFRYGYRYKLKKNGEQEDKPDKNEFSHGHDANQYGDMVIESGATGSYLFKSAKREVKEVSFNRLS